MVSLAPSATEIVCALRCGDRLVARTAFCDYPPEVTELPSVGGWTTVEVESVVAREPDLVLTSTFLQDGIVAALRACGTRVCHTDPKTLGDVLSSFETIAVALGVPDHGRALHQRVESGLSALPRAPRAEATAPRVYAEEWPRPAMASGNWVPDLIAAAGGRSLLRSGERSRAVTLDEVRAFDPDVVILNYCGMRAVPVKQQRQQLAARPGWDELRVVRAGRVFVLDDSLLNRPGPRLAEGAQRLQRVLVRASARSSRSLQPPFTAFRTTE